MEINTTDPASPTRIKTPPFSNLAAKSATPIHVTETSLQGNPYRNLADQLSRHRLGIKGGYSASEILLLGQQRSQNRAKDIQETKKELAKSKKREQEALQQKQEALQQKQEAIQLANDLATQLEKLQAKFAALEAAGLIQKEDA